MRVIDLECFNELATTMGSADAAGALIEPGIKKKELIFADEVERELRAIDDQWNRWFIDHKIHGTKLDETLQVEVRRLLRTHKDLVSVFDLRGQTTVFSLALCTSKKSSLVYPVSTLPKQFSKLGKCLTPEKIDWVDSNQLFARGGGSR